MSASLGSALERNRADERRRAVRALLMRPLMNAGHEDFPLVRRHADALRTWFEREVGWVLHVEQNTARLFKRPGDLLDETRGALGFDRRRYVLLCLVCAILERSEVQITLQNIGDELMRAATEPDLAARGFAFALEHVSERRDLVHVCRFLIDCGALSQVAGDEEAFVAQARARGDALYDVHRRVLASLLACVRGPSTFAPESAPTTLEGRLHALVDEYVPEGPDGRRTAIRHMLARRLLDDPVVYVDELDEAARDYFSNQRGPLAARLAELTDLEPELRAEGAALIDPDGELSDSPLPAEGTLSHATLLVAELLAREAASDDPRPVPESHVASYLRGAADTYGRFWRKAERAPGAEHALAREALTRLHKLRLVTWVNGAVRALPALARYRLGEPEVRKPAPRAKLSKVET